LGKGSQLSFCRGSHGQHQTQLCTFRVGGGTKSLTLFFLDGLSEQKTSLLADHVVTKTKVSEAVLKS
jgi:hypothetical protein